MTSEDEELIAQLRLEYKISNPDKATGVLHRDKAVSHLKCALAHCTRKSIEFETLLHATCLLSILQTASAQAAEAMLCDISGNLRRAFEWIVNGVSECADKEKRTETEDAYLKAAKEIPNEPNNN